MLIVVGLAGCGGDDVDFVASVDDITLTGSYLDKLYSMYSEREMRLSNEPIGKLDFVHAWVDQTLLGLYAADEGYTALVQIETLSGILKREVVLRTMGNELILNNVTISEHELREMYDSTSSELKILHYKSKSRKNVETMIGRMDGGESFDKYAMTDLLPQIEERPGGFYRQTDIPSELMDVLSDLAIGELSEIVELREMFLVMQITDRRGVEIGPFEEQRPIWEKTLLETKAHAARNAFVDSLFTRYPVKTDDEGIHLIHSMIEEYEVSGGAEPFFKKSIDGRENVVLVTMGPVTVTLGGFYNEFKYMKPETRPFLMSKFIQPYLKSHALEKVMYIEAMNRGLDEIDYIRFLLEDADREAKAYCLREEMRLAVEFDTAEIDEYIRNNIDEFTYPDRILIRELVVKDENEIREILRDLDNGASFKELAKERSISVTANSHGRIGPFIKDRYPDYWSVADSLEPGEFTNPIFEKNAWAIIKLEERLNRVPMEKEFSRKLALKAMKADAQADRMRSFLETLAEDYKVRYSVEYAS